MRRLAPLLTAATTILPVAAAGRLADAESQSVAGADAARTWSGGYRLSYFGATVGEESFTIRKTDDGYVIDATLEMSVGDKPPVRSTYRLDRDRRFLSATYEELTEGGVTAEYTLANGRFSVVATDASGAEVGRMSFDAGADAIIGGPHYVTDFYVLGALGLDVGQEIDANAFVFGFDGWKITPVDLSCARKRDRRIPGTARYADEMRFCECEIDTGEEVIETRSWLDSDRLSNRVSIDRAIGSVVVRLTKGEGD